MEEKGKGQLEGEFHYLSISSYYFLISEKNLPRNTRELFSILLRSKDLILSVDGAALDVEGCVRRGRVRLSMRQGQYLNGNLKTVDGYFYIDLPVHCESLLTNGVYDRREPALAILNQLLDSKVVFLRNPSGVAMLPEEELWGNDEYTIEFVECKGCYSLELELTRRRREVEELKLAMEARMKVKVQEEIEEEKFVAPPSIEPVAQSSPTEGGKGGIQLSTSGLTMSVNEREAKKDLKFSIENVPIEQAQIIQEVIPASEILSPLFKLGPHNVNFSVPIALEFEFKEGTERPALFIQEEEGVEIGALCRVPSLINGNKLVMKAKRFCNVFVAESFETKTGSSSILDGPDTITDGLNFRGKCNHSTCSRYHKFITFHAFYPTVPLDLLNPTYRQTILCPVCNHNFEPRQILFCNAMFTIEYSREDQSNNCLYYDNHVVGNFIQVIGNPNAPKAGRYGVFNVEIQRAICYAGVANNYSNSDACINGAFDGTKSILFGNFYIGEDPIPCDAVYEELLLKGFKVDRTNSPGEFASRLPSYDIGSLVSGQTWVQGDQDSFVTACMNHLQQGRALYLWAENAPFFLHSNMVLRRLFAFRLLGNTPGNRVLQLSETLETGTFLRSHFITTGVVKLHEGITIAHPPPGPVHNEVKVLAHSSDGHPVILYSDKTTGRGRVVIDCGYTKMRSKEWNVTEGTRRYVVNAFCWLAGVTVYNEYYTI